MPRTAFSGMERVAVGCARRRATHGIRTHLKSHRVAGAENRSERSEQEALVEIDPMGGKKIAVLLDECPLPVMLCLPPNVGPDVFEIALRTTDVVRLEDAHLFPGVARLRARPPATVSVPLTRYTTPCGSVQTPAPLTGLVSRHA